MLAKIATFRAVSMLRRAVMTRISVLTSVRSALLAGSVVLGSPKIRLATVSASSLSNPTRVRASMSLKVCSDINGVVRVEL